MSLPTSKIVTVTTTVNPIAATEGAFSTLLIVESTGLRPTGSRIGSYASMNDVAVDYPANSEPYKAAQVFFSEVPHPATLFIGSRFLAATHGELLGSVGYAKLLSTFTAVTSGSLSLTIDGTVESTTGINLSTATTLNGVAALIQTAVDVTLPGVTVLFNGSRFIVRSPTTGIVSSVGFPNVPGAGTDLAPLLALRAIDGALLTPGSAIESVATSLDKLAASPLQWYVFTLTNEAVDADLLNASAWAEANNRIHAYTTTEAGALDANNTTDIGSVMKGFGYKYTFGQYDQSADYGVVSAMANILSVDFLQVNSSKTLAFKQESGIVPSALTAAQSAVLESKNLNYYSTFGSSAMLYPGQMADGTYFDQRQGLDWVTNHIQLAVFNGVTSQPKIPQTDKGVAQIIHFVSVAINDAVNNGFVAEGAWNGSGVGTVRTGDVLPSGYYVYGAPVGKQSAASFSARIAPPITVLMIGAGAIQKVNIALQFQA